MVVLPACSMRISVKTWILIGLAIWIFRMWLFRRAVSPTWGHGMDLLCHLDSPVGLHTSINLATSLMLIAVQAEATRCPGLLAVSNAWHRSLSGLS